MKAYKMLFLLRDFMKSMSELGIKMDDYKYIDLCQEYNELVSKGNKREYARAVLSRKYSVSESTVFRIITRMNKSIKT